jgi:prefoldin subunit 5
MNNVLDLAKAIQISNTLLSSIAKAAEVIQALQQQVSHLQGRIDYYEGKSENWIEGTLMDGMRHRFDGQGRCIRCGTDAEDWDLGCVEELNKELEQVRAELAKVKGEGNGAQ